MTADIIDKTKTKRYQIVEFLKQYPDGLSCYQLSQLFRSIRFDDYVFWSPANMRPTLIQMRQDGLTEKFLDPYEGFRNRQKWRLV